MQKACFKIALFFILEILFSFFMKRTFFSFFLGASLLCIPLGISAQADVTTDSFLEHLEATLSSDFSLTGTASLSGKAEGENFLTLASVVQAAKQDLRFEEHGDMKIFFDTTPFSETSEYNEIPALSGTLRAGYDMFSDIKNQELRMKVRDLDLKVNAKEKEVKTIVEGFFEIYKMGQNNVYGINLDDILSFVKEEEGEDFQEIFSDFSSFYADPEGNTAELYRILLESGLLSVSQKENGDFVLSLSSDGKNIDIKKLLEILSLFGIPQKIIQEAESEIPSDFIAQSIASEILQYIDLEVTYTPKNNIFSHITPSLQFSFPYEVKNYNYRTYEYETEKTIDFSFDFSGDFTLSSLEKEVVLPKADIDLGKFFQAIFTMIKVEEAQWKSYNENYEYDNVPDLKLETEGEGIPEEYLPFDPKTLEPRCTSLEEENCIFQDEEDGYYYRKNPAAENTNPFYKDPTLLKRR